MDEAALSQFRALQALVRAVRNARADYRVDPAKRVAVRVVASTGGGAAAAAAGAAGGGGGGMLLALSSEAAVIAALAKADPEQLEFSPQPAAGAGPGGGEPAAAAARGPKPVHLVIQDGLEAFLPMAGLVEVDKERKRLTKQRDQLVKDVEGLSKRLSSPGFAGKAPPEVVAEAQQTLADKQEQLAAVSASLLDLTALE